MRRRGARPRLRREPLRSIELAVQRVHRVPAVRAGAQRGTPSLMSSPTLPAGLDQAVMMEDRVLAEDRAEAILHWWGFRGA